LFPLKVEGASSKNQYLKFEMSQREEMKWNEIFCEFHLAFG
jgi:hypothetical protein